MSIENQILSPGELPIVPSMVWLGFSLILFVVSMLAVAIIKKYAAPTRKQAAVKTVLVFVESVLKKPFILFLSGYALYVLMYGMVIYTPNIASRYTLLFIDCAIYVRKITEFIAFFWALLNLLNQGEIKLENWLTLNNKKLFSILLPMLSNSLKTAVLLLMLNILIPALGINALAEDVLAKVAKVTLIIILTWLVVRLLDGVEKLILNQYAQDENAILTRKINTQVLLLKKVILILVCVVSLAAILMAFDSVKSLGTGLLTTAGVISAIGAFASQQSLGRIFAGLQIAFSQPIRIGDTVIIDNEQGQVEEITLSYIVIKLWDFRRLILPSDYFTNRSLQNLSRTSSELLGSVIFYADYQLPLAPVRAEFTKILAASSLWNGQVSNFQVTDIKDNGMELRALVSARDSGTLWDLRCEIREKLMHFITVNYPHCLPKGRSISWKNEQEAS